MNRKKKEGSGEEKKTATVMKTRNFACNITIQSSRLVHIGESRYVVHSSHLRYELIIASSLNDYLERNFFLSIIFEQHIRLKSCMHVMLWKAFLCRQGAHLCAHAELIQLHQNQKHRMCSIQWSKHISLTQRLLMGEERTERKGNEPFKITEIWIMNKDDF